ncbi:MAG: DNA recombination protein RmuC [Chloroflexi bacterium]|nr:DNA recombination protein RmuC [Chloroflexota bacterium]
MAPVWIFLALVLGIVLGASIAWLVATLRTTKVRADLETMLRLAEERLEESRRTQDQTLTLLSTTFKALAADALRGNNETFLQSAKQVLEKHLVQAQGDLDLREQAVEQLVKPLGEALKDIEQQRQSAYGSLKQLVEGMSQGQDALGKETRNLVQALRTPYVRGRWGELTLRRVAELAGMVKYCDFIEQVTLEGEENARKRPDMIVHLPNQRSIAVDAKAPLDAYLQAIEANSEEVASEALKRHARQLRERARDLANKSYWTALGYTPEFVVLFLPGEPFLAAALQQEPTLLEQTLADRVVLATPSTLIALLHAVAYGWREEQITDNARRIAEMGREIHDRIVVWANHLLKLGDSLGNTVEAFNEGIGALEHRVLISARRFKEYGVSSDRQVPEIPPVDITSRKFTIPGEPAKEGPDTIEVPEISEPRSEASQALSAPQVLNPSTLTTDEQEFLTHLPDSGPIGNKALRQRLGWDREQYFRVRNDLVGKGKLSTGRGRGGSVSRMNVRQGHLDGK